MHVGTDLPCSVHSQTQKKKQTCSWLNLFTQASTTNRQLKGGHFSQNRRILAPSALTQRKHVTTALKCMREPNVPCAGWSCAAKIYENLSVGYENLNYAHFTQQTQLCCTRNHTRFWPILGPKFNRISRFFVAGFPLGAFKTLWGRGPGPMSSVRGNRVTSCVCYGQKGRFFRSDPL